VLGGIYASTLRHHDGVFYMVTTNVSHGGNFLVHTRNIRGEWSEPVWIAHEGIDPSLFFDDDGTAYFCSTTADQDGQGIALYEINPATGALLTPMRIVCRGSGGKFPEAPHLYKISGWYYLMIAEGGTEYGHMETIFRAKSPFGPYEPCPRNPILTHRDYQGAPIQATGHAELVEDRRGNWWLACLGIRTLGFQMLHNLGRESFLAPVVWDADGWPVVGNAGRIDLEMTSPLPAPPSPKGIGFEEDFRGKTLCPEWNFVRNPRRENYRLTGEGLKLTADKETLSDEEPTLVAFRQKDFDVRAEARLNRFEAREGGMAGLTAFYNQDYHYEIGLIREGGQAMAALLWTLHGMTAVAAKHPLEASDGIEFRLEASRERYKFLYREGGDWVSLGELSAAGLCTEGTKTMTFTGTHIGPLRQWVRGLCSPDFPAPTHEPFVGP
jgi:alpha-N-arabinofuranosidase